MRYRIRTLAFDGADEFPQGYGMTWDSVVIDVADNERIIDAQAGSTSDGCGFDGLRPRVRVWLMAPEDGDEPCEHVWVLKEEGLTGPAPGFEDEPFVVHRKWYCSRCRATETVSDPTP